MRDDSSRTHRVQRQRVFENADPISEMFEYIYIYFSPNQRTYTHRVWYNIIVYGSSVS